MLNKVMLIGRLGRDPEMRYTQTGEAMTTFSLATGSKEYTEWHDVVAWGRVAETANTFLAKGRLAYVEGRIQTRKYKGRDGEDKTAKQIVASLCLSLARSPREEDTESPQDDDHDAQF